MLSAGAGGNGGSSGGSGGTAGGAGGALGGSSSATGADGTHGSTGNGGAGGGGFLGGGGGAGSNGAAGGGGGGGTSYTDASRVSGAARSVASAFDDGKLVLTFNGTAAQTTSFSCVSRQESYTIPSTAKALRVIAIGAKGGDAKDAYGNVLSGTTSGLGAGFDALITSDNLPADRVLRVVVGCQGGSGQTASWFSSSAAGGAGGYGVFSGGSGGNDKPGTDPKDGALGGNGGGGASGVFGGTVVPRFPLIVGWGWRSRRIGLLHGVLK